MARILFAWELGGSYGHLGQLIPVARELKKRGHDVVFALRELLEAERLLAPHGFVWYQAPLWTGRILNLPEPLNHAEMLMHFGFLNPDGLLSVCRAWRHLVELLAPDLVVFDYAPTAQLACRGLAVARLGMATGYFVPPDTQPLRSFRWWSPPPLPRLVESERRVTTTANVVLRELGAPPVSSVHAIMSSGNDVFTTLPELDHFPARDKTAFVGPIFALGRGEPPVWPVRGGRRIFAYLKPDYAALEPLLDALDGLDASVLVHIPGAARRTIERHASDHMRIEAQPQDIEEVRTACDFAVLHAGLGTVSAMLLAGKPVFNVPQQLEQTMFARAIEPLGATVTIAEAASGQFARHLKRALADTSLVDGARRFAARYADYDQHATIAGIADRCEAAVASGAGTQTMAG